MRPSTPDSHPETPNHSRQTAEQTIALMKSELAADYDLEFDLSTEPSTNRYIARKKSDGSVVLITLAEYPQALNAMAIKWQNEFLPQLREPELPSLCPLVSATLKPWGQAVVSSLLGNESLFQIVRRLGKLPFEEVAELLSGLSTVLEQAAASKYVAPLLNSFALYPSPPNEGNHSRMIGLPIYGIPLPFAPDVPGWPDLTEMSGTSAFVPQLARLACELLGTPVRGGKYRQNQEIGDHGSSVLRNVIEGGEGYRCATDFTLDLIGKPFAGKVLRGKMTERGSVGSSTFSESSRQSLSADVHVSTSYTNYFHPHLGTKNFPPRMLPGSEFAATAAPSRCRLVIARSPTSWACGLVSGRELWIGRSPEQADFQTYFLPANPKNVTKTQVLSRKHCRIFSDAGSVWLADAAGVNQSFSGGQPINGTLKVGASGHVMVGGEYDLEIGILASQWDQAVVWQDLTTPATPNGSVILRGPSTGVFPSIAALVLTDLAFGVGNDGQLRFGPLGSKDLVGWFLQRNGGLWIAAASNGNIEINGRLLEPGTALPLLKDDRLSICRVEYAVKSFA